MTSTKGKKEAGVYNSPESTLWKKGLINGLLLYGGLGVVVTIVSFLLPPMFYHPPWSNDLLSLGSQREVVIGSGIGIFWAIFVLRQMAPIMIGIIALWGILMVSLEEGTFRGIAALICIVIGLLVAFFATREKIKTQ